jgi:hypothetical protein
MPTDTTYLPRLGLPTGSMAGMALAQMRARDIDGEKVGVYDEGGAVAFGIMQHDLISTERCHERDEAETSVS